MGVNSSASQVKCGKSSVELNAWVFQARPFAVHGRFPEDTRKKIWHVVQESDVFFYM